LVGVTHTVDEAKAMAEENEYDTEHNERARSRSDPASSQITSHLHTRMMRPLVLPITVLCLPI